MITTLSKILFWIRYTLIMILFGIMSILSIVLFPLAFYLRYKTSKDWLWFLLNNETDFGEQWWKKREGITKDTFWTAWRWNLRNSSWNFKTKVIKPEWNGGITRDFKTITNTFESKWTWANKETNHGKNHCYYIPKTRVEGRYSYANKSFEIQLGAAGNRYKLRLKL